MLELMKKQITEKYTDICLRVPTEAAPKIMALTKGFLELAGQEVREINENEEELFSASEVFPNSHPGRILRGLRVREDMTQAQLAKRAGIRPHHISEMEHGKRSIGKDTAKRLAKALNADPRQFISV